MCTCFYSSDEVQYVDESFLSSGSYMYHLRVYVYQARTLCAMDKDSFSGKKKENLIGSYKVT